MTRLFRDREKATGFAPVDFDTLRANRGWLVGLGVVFMLLGFLAVLLPLITSLVTMIALGWLMVLAGLIEGYHALQNRRWGDSGWALGEAVVQVVAGGLVVAFPVVGKLALTLILAAYFAAEGVFKLVRAVQHRGARASGWLVLDGLLSLGLGILILLRWPSVAVWALGLFVGVNLLFGGSSMLLLGLSGRMRARA